jgi:7-cyano-7-deazaguanine synthase
MNAYSPRAVVLLSGGLDSTTVLALAASKGFQCNCLSFAYGQRQSIELDRARQVARHYAAERHLILRVDLDAIGGSALTDDIPVPKDRQQGTKDGDIPVTYVPGRNIIFLAHALSWAEVLGASDIDYSGYPDCRPSFLTAFEQMANLGTKAGTSGSPFRLHAPLLHMSKKEIILLGMELGVDYGLTHSCYDPEGEKACGRCDACILRLQGFREAGASDPARYAEIGL